MFRLRRSIRILIAILVASAATLAADPALPQDFPRLGLYASMHGDGVPLWDSTGTVIPSAADGIARFNVVSFDASPLTEYRPDALLALRARRPDLKLFAYVNGHYTWFPLSSDSLVHYPTRYHRLVRDMGGFLYNQYGEYYGTRFQTFANVNIAKRVAGRYVIAEALADLFYDATVREGHWDGVFIDTYCDDISWMEGFGETVDYARAGYADRASFLAGWRAGTDTLASRLRALSGSAPILIGNCGPGTKYAWFNGWMRENFPLQNGGTWYSNMLGDPGGYFIDEQRFRAPRYNYIFTAVAVGQNPYDANNARRQRFGLASASLGDGYHVIGNPERIVKLSPYHTWWYDEYAVDLATGQSSAQQQHTGWLGQALGAAYQMIWVGTNPDASPNPDVETDLTGWAFSTGVGSTMERDTTTAGSGSASILVRVPTAGAAGWYTTLRTTGSINAVAGGQYAATFWAKAATPRRIRVALGRTSGGGDVGSQAVDVTTSWRRHQVVLTSIAASGVNLQFHLAAESGDVWIDDAHLQQGATSVWRRDFQNGSVLVNPSAQALTVPLERTFRAIAGTVDPATNNGASLTQLTLAPSDARFLIGDDFVPPADVADLRALPPGALP